MLAFIALATVMAGAVAATVIASIPQADAVRKFPVLTCPEASPGSPGFVTPGSGCSGR